MGKESKKEWIYAYIYIKLTHFAVNYMPIKNFFNKNKIKSVII